MSIGDFPESLSQAILVGIILVLGDGGNLGPGKNGDLPLSRGLSRLWNQSWLRSNPEISKVVLCEFARGIDERLVEYGRKPHRDGLAQKLTGT